MMPGSWHASNCARGLYESQEWEKFKKDCLKTALRELFRRPLLPVRNDPSSIIDRFFPILDLFFNNGEAWFVGQFNNKAKGRGCSCADV
jgi:hypothetical protein